MRLQYWLAALSHAQKAALDAEDAAKEIQSSTDVTASISALLTEQIRVHRDLRCSQANLDAMPLWDSDSVKIKSAFAKCTDARLHVVDDLVESSKKAFLSLNVRKSRAQQLKDAERTAARNDQNDRVDSAQVAINAAIMAGAIDLNDENATTTLAMTCEQAAKLREKAAALANESESLYTEFAGVIVQLLDGRKCHGDAPVPYSELN